MTLNRMHYLLACLLVGGLFTASAHAVKTGDQFTDWVVACEQPNEEIPELCHIFQNLTLKEEGVRVLHVQVGFIPDKAHPVAIFTLPLGVALPPGIRLKVDEHEPVNFPIEVCVQDGCRAGLELTPDRLNMMKRGNKANVTFANIQRQGLTVPVSLSGFTAGVNALR